MDGEKELTATESCRRLGITLDALYRLLYAGKLTGRKVEGVWRIPLSAIEQRQKRKANAQRSSEPH
jgi:excisionase family DNA binding protein